jgi:hypothetical protein
MTSKFEQLIEYVINDEEAKAKELFHDIVVEKSREIYENLMNEEELDEEESDAERDDHAEKAGKKVAKDIEYDELHEEDEEELDENMMGDEELSDSIDAEEQGMAEGDESDAEFDDEAEEAGSDLTHDIEADHDADEGDIEDRVVDLEDKLDELMAEFESLMGDDGVESDLAGDDGEELGGDAMAQDDTMAFADQGQMMEENVQLDKVPAPKGGDDGANSKSPVAANSGSRGAVAKPVTMTGDTAQGRSAPGTKDLPEAGKFKNVPGKGTAASKLEAAPKPVTAQASGVNTKTPFPKA